MHKVIIDLECPKCRYSAKTSVEESYDGFLLFVCPKCNSNVVYYDNKMDIISDQLVHKLVRTRRLKTCGIIMGTPVVKRKLDQPVSSDDILNLKIALETSKDVSDFIRSMSKI